MVKAKLYNIKRDDSTIGKIHGTAGNDHLIHHRDPDINSHSSTGLVGFGGNDTLQGSVPDAGQIHMFGGPGDNTLILDVTKDDDAAGHQGHHAYGGPGENAYKFTNIAENKSPIVGRLDDFDPTSDKIFVEGVEIDLSDLPVEVKVSDDESVDVRVVEIEHPEFKDEELGPQQFLAIGDNIFYALEGARDLKNGATGLVGEERHFLLLDALDKLRSAEDAGYTNPKNFVPHGFYKHREEELKLLFNPGSEVKAESESGGPVHIYGGKTHHDDETSPSAQLIYGGMGDDVINGNTGNNTIYGGGGDNLIAGGVDNSLIHGGPGNDSIWGGDGENTLIGGEGDDYLHGGRGNDSLNGGAGSDLLVGGGGDNILIGGGDDSDVNRFHFNVDDGHDTILDFKVDIDIISIQHEIDPLTVEVLENEEKNTVINYGLEASIELKGIGLDDFKKAADIRTESGDSPLIVITPDPEEIAKQEILIENGFYDDKEPPSLYVDGILYGNDAFVGADAGGYTYVSDPAGGADPAKPNPAPPNPQDDDDDDDDEGDDGSDGSCFVATAAYQDRLHPDVVFLRGFRDQWLHERAWGRCFIAFYWWIGPKLAGPVRRNDRLRRISKGTISAVVRILRRVWV